MYTKTKEIESMFIFEHRKRKQFLVNEISFFTHFSSDHTIQF